ncbi:hypothetical protein F2Q68_00026026 [Brassica cretica]|uniref:Uncharacterized protein n=1 Tax=Brassica cretica TaxID=69181 RepID=A0A8S9I9K8_BRACR|nr:hypothetical protein F2Q68_00026026 [Brassica cretica]
MSLSASPVPQTGVFRSIFESLRLGRSSQSIASGLLRFWISDILHIYIVLEYHMEFLEAFGCIWSSKEVFKAIIGRAEQGSEVPQRRHEVAPKHLSERPSWSDPVKSLAILTP